MGKKKSRSFEVIDWEPYKIMSIDSRRIDECMRFYKKRKLDGVSISPHEGYKLKDLSFLKDYPFIEGVVVAYGQNIDISGVHVLQGLKFISLGDGKYAIDLSNFSNLEEIRVRCHQKLVLPKKSTRVKSLYLSRYSPTSKDFHELPRYVNLESLEVVLGSVQSLAGLERFKRLTSLDLHRLTKLERIGDLKSASLEFLHIEKCKKISDHSHVTNLENLRVLRFADCGSMPSLKFINRMPKLEELSFAKTNVEDGDLSPCLRLKWVGFLNKRHYSHTEEEVDAILAERANKDT
jgi:hypothetical protein